MKLSFKDTSAAFVEAMSGYAKSVDFASVVALTRTAYKVKDAQVQLMTQKLDRPTRFALNSLYVKAATKENRVAFINTKEGFGSVPAGRYLSPLIEGGERRMKAHEKLLGSYTGPTPYAPLDAFGNVPGSVYKRILSQLKASSDPMQNATGSKRSKKKRAAESYFKVGNLILSRKRGASPVPMLFLLRRVPTYSRLLPWFETAEEVVDKTLPTEYFKALEKYSN